MSREPALLTSAGRMPRAQPASSERRAGCPERTSGDGTWAAPNRGVGRRRGVSKGKLKTCPHGEPALAASGGRMPGAQPASSERSPGWAQRTSGDGAWATRTDPSPQRPIMSLMSVSGPFRFGPDFRSQTALLPCRMRLRRSCGGRSFTAPAVVIERRPGNAEAVLAGERTAAGRMAGERASARQRAAQTVAAERSHPQAIRWPRAVSRTAARSRPEPERQAEVRTRRSRSAACHQPAWPPALRRPPAPFRPMQRRT